MIALATKYQPKRIRDFAGLTRAKAIMGQVARNDIRNTVAAGRQ